MPRKKSGRKKAAAPKGTVAREKKSVASAVRPAFEHSPNRAEIAESRHEAAVALCRKEVRKLSQLCGPVKRRHAVRCEECRAAVQAVLETEMERS